MEQLVQPVEYGNNFFSSLRTYSKRVYNILFGVPSEPEDLIFDTLTAEQGQVKLHLLSSIQRKIFFKFSYEYCIKNYEQGEFYKNGAFNEANFQNYIKIIKEFLESVGDKLTLNNIFLENDFKNFLDKNFIQVLPPDPEKAV